MRASLAILLSLLVIAAATSAFAAATITIVNLDGAGEGFNDPTAVAPVGGNSGTTIGQQRLNVFQEAADIWGGILDSAVEIRVQAKFDPMTCDPGGGVLGGAGAVTLSRDFAGAEFPATWYHIALANKLRGFDGSGSNDINATFNSDIDNNNNCLAGTDWYYGLDGNEGTDIELLPVVLHELAHGLGFSNFVTLSTGAEVQGLDDIYERHILDTSTGEHWNTMTDGERVTSSVNTTNVVWDGNASTLAAPHLLGDAPVMVINSPGSIAGTLLVGTASFGPELTTTAITGNLILVDDGTGVATDGCEALINGGAVNGNIALIDRGSCAFVDKALAAEAAGAIAVVIANNVAGVTPNTLGGTDPGLTIPTVSITLDDGNAIKAELGGGVNVSLVLDTNLLAGADSQNRVRLYAPDPVELGSSISHWDVSASPNLLMEPAINGNLSSDIDMTRYLFEDIGWLPRVTSTPPTLSTRLGRNFPNPFNPSTTISFDLGKDGEVSLAVYDLAGRRVKDLVSSHLTAGPYSVRWNGTDSSGGAVATGVYMYVLKTDEFTESQRMVLLK